VPIGFDYSTIRQQCEALQGRFAICFGTAGDMDFINSIGRARGMEESLDGSAGRQRSLHGIDGRAFDFYFEQHKKVLEAAKGLIDFTTSVMILAINGAK